jgi:signal transduction histidine kinase
MGNQPVPKYILSRESLHPDLYGDFTSVENLEFLQTLINSSPFVSILVNKQRQVILSNFQLIETAGLDSIEQIIGKRPGDIFSCLNRNDNSACGDSEGCQLCGILKTVRESQSQAKKVINECRIRARDNHLLVFYEFRVICSPVYFNGEMYTLVNLIDISNEKRSGILENVFFHDILNRLGGLSGIIQVIKSENQQKKLYEYIDLLEIISEMVIEEIQSQHELKAAEKNDLILNLQSHTSFGIIELVRKQISFHPVMNNLNLEIDPKSQDFVLKTDSVLLKRILLNMTKNAAEATTEKGTIMIGCYRKQDSALFSVNNPGVIPEEVRLQIFQRSYSTKGNGRGLGTYSMKLFGENYLKGKVDFYTTETEGTTFTIELPLE